MLRTQSKTMSNMLSINRSYGSKDIFQTLIPMVVEQTSRGESQSVLICVAEKGDVIHSHY
jgi:hypothetical protein